MSDAVTLSGTMNELTVLAKRVVDGDIEHDNDQRAELCTRHGPAAVRMLDEFYEAQVRIIREAIQ